MGKGTGRACYTKTFKIPTCTIQGAPLQKHKQAHPHLEGGVGGLLWMSSPVVKLPCSYFHLNLHALLGIQYNLEFSLHFVV